MTSSCEEHDQSWHLLTQKGDHLCAKCCQTVLKSSLESDSTRKQVLSQLEASFRLTPKLATTLTDSQSMNSGDTQSLVVCISLLLYHSDSQMRQSAKNCINLLTTQMKDQKVIELIFGDIVEKISIDTDFWNESVLDLMADLIPDISMAVYYLRDDFNSLFKRFHYEFNRLNDRLKTSLLRVFNEFYQILKSNELFVLDIDFQQKTLVMVFNAFEGFNKNLSDRQLVLNSIELLTKLSQIESILKPLTTDQNLIKYVNKLLNDKSVEVKCKLLDWICKLLENESIQRCFASTLEKEMMNSFAEQLFSSNNPSFSRPLIDCLCLILEKTRKTMSEIQLDSLLKSAIKSLDLSLNTRDNLLFKITLTLLKQIIKRKPNQSLSEFDFFSILDLLELSITVSDLFPQIVEFLAEFFNFQIIPILIPTQRITKIIKTLLVNIRNTNSDGEDYQQYINRTISFVKLLKSCLKLINEKKNKEFDGIKDGQKDVHLLNIEKQWNCNDFDLEDIREDSNSIKVSKRTEIYEFISYCLERLEDLFINTLKVLPLEEYFQQNSQLFQEICLCFDIIIENDLFVAEDINQFVKRMFSNGYVLSLVQLLWFHVFPISCESFISQLCSLLSHFLFKIQEIQETDQMEENEFEPILIQKAFNEFKEKCVNNCEETSDNLCDDTYKQFVDIFFAVNYFCQISLPKDVVEMDSDYMKQFLKVLNNFLQNRLNDDRMSCLPIKHSLFLSSLSYLDESSLNALQLFFESRDDTFYSKYYTNHIKLLNWMFTHLKCEPFCKFALKMFFKEIPDSDLHLDEKHKISSFFELIDSNERAVQLLINTLCDTKENDPTIDVILMILEDSELFIDEYDIHQNWNNFCERLCEQIPFIVDNIITQIKVIISSGMSWNIKSQDQTNQPIDNQMDDSIDDPIDDPMDGYSMDDLIDNPNVDQLEDIDIVNPESLAKVIKLLTFLYRLLSNERNVIYFESFGFSFEELLRNLCKLIDQFLDDSSVETIFKFFRLCLNSSNNCEEIEESLTNSLLSTKIGVTLLFSYVDNHLRNDSNKETALFLLSVLSKSKVRHTFKHQFVYEFEFNRLMDSLNSESKVETESAFVLLSNSFKVNEYFKSKEKNERIKCEELGQLLHCLQNAIFRKYITLTQISFFLKTFFNDLKKENSLLLEDLANSPWFLVIIDNYLEADEEENLFEDNDSEDGNEELDISLSQKTDEQKKSDRRIRVIREEFITFIVVFFELDFVNNYLIEVMNEMTEHCIQVINSSNLEIPINDTSIEGKILKCFKTIYGSEYVKHLTNENKEELEKLSEIKSFQSTIKLLLDHNYCRIE